MAHTQAKLDRKTPLLFELEAAKCDVLSEENAERFNARDSLAAEQRLRRVLEKLRLETLIGIARVWRRLNHDRSVPSHVLVRQVAEELRTCVHDTYGSDGLLMLEWESPAQPRIGGST